MITCDADKQMSTVPNEEQAGKWTFKSFGCNDADKLCGGYFHNDVVKLMPCEKCAVGKYSNADGQCVVVNWADHSTCAKGEEASTSAATTCVKCKPGSFGGADVIPVSDACVSQPCGQTACTACAMGKYGGPEPVTGVLYGAKVDTCNLCPANSYSDEEGSTACKACATGKVTTGAGSTSKSQCIAGCAEFNADKALGEAVILPT